MSKKSSIFKRIFNISNLYIIIWLLYNFHWNDVGAQFPILENLSTVFLAINLGISLICTCIVLAQYAANSFIRHTNVVLILFIIYGLIHVLFGRDISNIDKGAYLIGVLRTFLPIYTFFLFTKLGYITEGVIKFWFWFFLAETLLIYYSYRVVLNVDGFEELRTNNRAYLFVALLPFLYFFRNRSWLQYIIIALIVAFTFFSIKRGAILVAVLTVVYFFWKTFTNVSVSRKILVLASFVILIAIGRQYTEGLYNNSDVFQRRVESTLEGDTSNRDIIVLNLLDKYSNGNIFNILFGFGADSTLKEGLLAHNDWVEVLYNQGLLSLIAYFCFWLAWFKIWRKQEKMHSELSVLIGLLFVSNFPKTFYSMWYSNSNMFITLPIGYFLALLYQKGGDGSFIGTKKIKKNE